LAVRVRFARLSIVRAIFPGGRDMLRFTRACLTGLILAFVMPGAARAMPVSFEFSGVVTDPSAYLFVAIGDPFTATLSYDTNAPIVYEDANLIVYEPVAFELHVGVHSWFSVPDMTVHKSGFTVAIGNDNTGAYARLIGVDLLPPGGALPTALDLAAMTISHEVQGIGPGGRLFGEITSIRQTPGPDPTVVPEPATLTLSAFGLAAIVARRRLVAGKASSDA
jgi:PEP-CTERM motif